MGPLLSPPATPVNLVIMAKLTMAGSYVAIITPFTEADEVDYAKLEELVEWHVQEGTAGIVPCGTTGESPTLSEEETKKVIQTVVNKAAKRIQVVAGAGSNCTKKAVHLTQQAKDLGCDAVLTVIPYYNKPTQDGLYAHFKAIADVGIPLMLYNIPGRCAGPGLSSATIAKLAALPTVVAIKEATGSVDFASEIANACNLQILSGDDSLTLPLMSIGGTGVVSVVANIAPRKVADLCKAMQAGDLATAKKIHFELYKLCKTLSSLQKTRYQCQQMRLGMVASRWRQARESQVQKRIFATERARWVGIYRDNAERHMLYLCAIVYEVMFVETNPIPVKAAGAMMGKWKNICRLPITTLKAENEAPLRTALQAASLL